MTIYFFWPSLGDNGGNVRPSTVWLALAASLPLVACYAELSGSAPLGFDELDAGLPGGNAGGAAGGGNGGGGNPGGGNPGEDASSVGGDDAGTSRDGEARMVITCDGAAVGTRESRTRYAQAQVVPPASCEAESQTRVCGEDGTWSRWSGTYLAEQCTVTSVRSCGATPHGGTATRVRYPVAKATNYTQCQPEEQTATCTDGTLSAFSGSAQYETCEVGFLGLCGLALFTDVDCEAGTECGLKSLNLQCLGSATHACASNNECRYTCVSGACTSAKVPRGGTCDDAQDCSACTSSGGQTTEATCATSVCVCGNGSSCTANNQCAGTCVAMQCVTANTTCDKDDDCRGAYKCIKPNSWSIGQCKLPDGEGCTDDAQCEHFCIVDTCGPLAQDGDECGENEDCASSLVCRDTGSGLHCAAPASIGGVCEETADCAQGLSCANVQGVKICMSAGPSGAPCVLAIDGSLQCASGVCECTPPSCTGMNPTYGTCQ